MLHKGLVVVTGPTGSGKSTTLAAMVDYAKQNRRDHIITVEDPIEFVHESKNSLVNHREVGIHTKSFSAALRGACAKTLTSFWFGECAILKPSNSPSLLPLQVTWSRTLHTQSAARTVMYHRRLPAEQQNKSPRHPIRSVKGHCRTESFNELTRRGRVAALEILVFTTAIGTWCAKVRPTRFLHDFKVARNTPINRSTMPSWSMCG